MGESKVVEAASSEQSSKRRLLQPPSCPLPPLGGASVIAKKTGRAPLEKSGGRQWESKRPFAKKKLTLDFSRCRMEMIQTLYYFDTMVCCALKM